MDFFFIKDKIKRGFYKVLSKLFYSCFFYSFGKGSKIVSPLLIKNARSIMIGKNVTINHGVFMMVETTGKSVKEPKLIVGDGVVVGNHNHIVAKDEVVIGNDVLIADYVYISDNYHSFEDIELPISAQPIKSKSKTVIGDGSWIGEKASVISASIGRHCVVAANSVVLTDVPDYSLVAGSPARIKKTYNILTKKWEKV